MAAGLGVFGFLYWLAVNQGLTTLEFVLRGALLYIGVAIIVLFQTEIRQALITFWKSISRAVWPPASRPVWRKHL